MDASMAERVEQLAEEIAGEAQTSEDLNGLLRLMMKTTLQRMLDTELDVHLGRRVPWSHADRRVTMRCSSLHPGMLTPLRGESIAPSVIQ